jgi:hypothetical protein
MQKELRYSLPGIVSLVIITCFVIYPAAAVSSFHVAGSGYAGTNLVKSPDSSTLADLMSHAVASYNDNPDQFSILTNSTAFSVPLDNFETLDGSSSAPNATFGALDSGFSVPTYTFSGLDGLSSAPDATFGALDSGFSVPTYTFSGLDGSSSAPVATFGALDSGFSVPTYTFSGLDGSSSAPNATFEALDGTSGTTVS